MQYIFYKSTASLQVHTFQTSQKALLVDDEVSFQSGNPHRISASHSTTSLYHLRKELALPSQPRPISAKSKWDWHHDCSQAPKQCASPLNTHTLEHLCCEKWKPSSDGGTKNDIGSNGGRSPITNRIRWLTTAAKHIGRLTMASRHQQDS